MNEKINLSSSFYVYILLDPRKFYIPFYVGKGHGDRDRQHLYPTNKHHNKFTSAVINKIRAANLVPAIIKWADGLTEDQAFEIEKELILRFGKRINGGLLTNLTDGGEGLSGHVFSTEHKEKIGLAHKGKILSDETKKKISISKTGSKASDETRMKMSLDRKGKRMGKENPMFGRKGEKHPNFGKGLKGKENPMFGRKHTPESIEKMKVARRNKKGQPSSFE